MSNSLDGFPKLNNIIIEKLRDNIDNNKMIIDKFYNSTLDDVILIAGFGDGTEAILISEFYCQKIIGVDISLSTDEEFRSNNLYLKKEDLSCLSFKNNNFGLIHCSHVLEHVHNPILVLNKLLADFNHFFTPTN